MRQSYGYKQFSNCINELISYTIKITEVSAANHYNVLHEDELLEANKQRVLLDISNSLNLVYTTTEQNENNNISVCTEVDDAYQNLIQMENYDLGSMYLDSVEFNTTAISNHKLQQEQQEKSYNIECSQQENADLKNIDLSISTVNLYNDSPSILGNNMTTSEVSVLAEKNTLMTISEISTGNHGEGDLRNPMIPEPITNGNILIKTVKFVKSYVKLTINT
ncbi:unnamed protein product [Parnassius apollo]|uniref:(apollo) hypothetical protein n=1 Tax=Parnassius apollo TaxID=110799 RepID=A0A8S3W0S1_PARAO|nr:unnamed protein product [Parnassius apollo]